jgi:hypothetical protein
MLTYAEELKQEGEIKGKIETIDNLLAVGADWTLITKATGITPGQFQTLKQQLRQLTVASASAAEKSDR